MSNNPSSNVIDSISSIIDGLTEAIDAGISPAILGEAVAAALFNPKMDTIKVTPTDSTLSTSAKELTTASMSATSAVPATTSVTTAVANAPVTTSVTTAAVANAPVTTSVAIAPVGSPTEAVIATNPACNFGDRGYFGDRGEPGEVSSVGPESPPKTEQGLVLVSVPANTKVACHPMGIKYDRLSYVILKEPINIYIKEGFEVRYGKNHFRVITKFVDPSTFRWLAPSIIKTEKVLPKGTEVEMEDHIHVSLMNDVAIYLQEKTTIILPTTTKLQADDSLICHVIDKEDCKVIITRA